MKKKTIELSINNEKSVLLNQNKVLIGKSSTCDIQLDNEQISHYHAFLEIDSESNIYVTDLNSEIGTFINGQRITERSFAILGDTLSFGQVHCDIFISEEEVEFLVLDKIISKNEVKEESIYVPTMSTEDCVLIDNEYCDIVFKEEPVYASDFSLDADFSGYIESESLVETFPILKRTGSLSLLVTTAINSVIIEQQYYSLDEAHITATNIKSTKNKVAIDILEGSNVPFIDILNEEIKIHPLEGFSTNLHSLKIGSDEKIILTKGDYQIFIQVADSPSEINKTPWFFREKDFLKDSSKVFACFLPFFLLLLVDFTIEKEPDPVSIVYKVRTSTKKSPKNETQMGSQAAKQEEVKKIVEKPKTVTPTPVTKTVEKVVTAKAPVKAPVKAYEFKMKTNLNNMFANTKSVAVDSKPSPSRSIASVSQSSLTNSLNKQGTGSGQVIKGIGSGLSNAKNDFGANGLSNKDGMDSSFIETQTVIMGSIDPELLRKILEQYLPQFRHCYQQELSYNSEDIKGIVDLNFEISSAGSVQKIKVSAKDARFSKKGTDCMGTVLGIINFPKPKGGGRVSVRQPLNFFAESEKT